jgi:hypothetical protein
MGTKLCWTEQHLKLGKIPFEEVKALLDGLPFYGVLCGIVKAITGSPRSSGATL